MCEILGFYFSIVANNNTYRIADALFLWQNAGTELRKKLRLLITRLQNNLSTAVENQDFKLASTIRAELEVAQKQYDSPLQDASLSLQSSSSASSSASLPPSSASDPAAGSVPSALRGGSDTAAVSGAAVDQQQNFQVDQTETKPDEKQVSEEQVQEAQNALRAQMIDALQSEDFGTLPLGCHMCIHTLFHAVCRHTLSLRLWLPLNSQRSQMSFARRC